MIIGNCISNVKYPDEYRYRNTGSSNSLYFAKNINFCGGQDVFMQLPKAAVVWDKKLARNIVKIFKIAAEDAPQTMKLNISSGTGLVLSCSKELSDGSLLEIAKYRYDKKRGKLYYLTVKEFKDGLLREAFGINMDTNELIGLNRMGNLAVLYDNCIKLSPNNPKYICYCDKLKSYHEEIFNPKIPPAELQTAPSSAKPVKTVKTKKIDNSACGQFTKLQQEKISDINSDIMNLTEFYRRHRSCSADIVKLKKSYAPLIYKDSKQKNLIFKYGKNQTLSVIHTNRKNMYTRIIFTDCNGYETHYLIEDCKRVISNLNRNYPMLMPEKLRYMTQEELKNSKISSYINFLKEEIEKYQNYLSENLKEKESKPYVRRNKPVNSKEKLNKFLDEITPKISTNIEELSANIEERANMGAQDLSSKYFELLAQAFEKCAKEDLQNFRIRIERFLEGFLK